MDKNVNKDRLINGEYSDYTIGLVLLDIVPVILFLLSGLVMFSMYDSYVLLAGVTGCFLGGLSKVIWKLIVVVRGRDIAALTKAFRVLMVGGFSLMLLSVILRAGSGSFKAFGRSFTSMPACIFFLLGFAGMCMMGYLGPRMDKSARSNWIEELTNTAAQLMILTGMIALYFGSYYHAGNIAAEVLRSSDNVYVTEIEEGYFFDGEGTDTALVFYPGAKVEPSAYAPLMKELAEDGTDCFLCRMPLNFALLDRDAANDIRNEYSYDRWYIAGHSLGGVAASMLAVDTDWDGIIFLASYPTEEMDIPVLSIYGSEDKVLNIGKYNEASEKGNFPPDMTEFVIEGGNHADFGDYGPQKGDGEALIPAESQWKQTSAAITEWIN